MLTLVGLQKLIEPYQNFLYALERYELIGPFWERIIAWVMPWGEVLLGVFMTLGLWLSWVLRACVVLFSTFILVALQAIWRDLPIDQCGCFGAGLSFSLPTMLIIDCFLLALTVLLSYRIDQTRAFSLDNYFME
jgi:hypothetical protein